MDISTENQGIIFVFFDILGVRHPFPVSGFFAHVRETGTHALNFSKLSHKL